MMKDEIEKNKLILKKSNVEGSYLLKKKKIK
jgi:hypothetical protein